jgi:hypothetical protein
MPMPPQPEFDALMQMIRALYAAQRPADPALAAELHAAAQALGQAGQLNRPRPPQAQPVCRFLDHALDAAQAGPGADVARALRPLAPLLHWELTYAAQPELAAFLENYAYADLLGPRGLAPSSQLTVGLLLLGPHTFYPRHDHPATEVYYVMSGTSSWQQGERPWASQPPGSLIFHRSHEPHAMATAGEPLLGLYLWRGALDVPAAWSE